MEPYYTNGQLIFFEDYENRYPVLVNQIKTFPNNMHDDGPDALSMAISGVISLLKPDKTVILPAKSIDGVSKWIDGTEQPWRNRSLANPLPDVVSLEELGRSAHRRS